MPSARAIVPLITAALIVGLVLGGAFALTSGSSSRPESATVTGGDPGASEPGDVAGRTRGGGGPGEGRGAGGSGSGRNAGDSKSGDSNSGDPAKSREKDSDGDGSGKQDSDKQNSGGNLTASARRAPSGRIVFTGRHPSGEAGHELTVQRRESGQFVDFPARTTTSSGGDYRVEVITSRDSTFRIHDPQSGASSKPIRVAGDG